MAVFTDKEIWGRIGKQNDFEIALLPTTMFHVGSMNTSAGQQFPGTIRGQTGGGERRDTLLCVYVGVYMCVCVRGGVCTCA